MENEILQQILATQNQILSMVTSLDSKVASLDGKVTSLDGKVTSLEAEQQKTNLRLDRLEEDVQSVKNTVLRIEDEHGKKIAALFDGYAQHTQMLERIESAVTRHEDFILRRIK